MTSNIYQPYTYLIGWSYIDLWYYGSRTRVNCTPDDLWVTYFTSSKHVKALRERYGEPDVIQIRRVFNTKQAARLCEYKVLTRINAAANPYFVNRHNAGKKFYIPGPFTQEHRNKISLALKGRPMTWGDKISANHKGHLPETRLKNSLGQKGRKLSQETKDKMAAAKRGKSQSAEHIAKRFAWRDNG